MTTLSEMAKKAFDENRVEVLIAKSGKERGAKFQFAFVEALERESIHRGRNPRDNSIAYVGIMRNQKGKIARFEEKAFPFSDKQVAEIARNLMNYPQ